MTPTRPAITAIMGRSVQGSGTEASVLDVWANNSVSALSSDTSETLVLSGPKVNSFFANLVGFVHEVTNDAWIANYAAVDQKIFSGALNATGTDPGKGSGYLAMSARVREAARRLSRLTGEMWTPAEVQETIWSWAKTLYEMADAALETRTARQLVRARAVTDDLINSTPDFGSLFGDATYQSILQEAGYGKELEQLRQQQAARAADGQLTEQEPGAGGQAAPFAGRTQQGHELRAADRLDALRERRRADAAQAAADDVAAQDDCSRPTAMISKLPVRQ